MIRRCGRRAPRTALALACAALVWAAGGGGAVLAAGQAAAGGAADDPAALDTAFAAFWAADSDRAAARAIDAVLAAGPTAGEVRTRLRAGREHPADAPTGRHLRSRRNRDGVRHDYVLRVPPAYDPRTPIPVRVYLHGGVMRPRPADGEWWRSEERWVRDDAIVVAPASWSESVWWRRSQIENLAGLLGDLKRVYNVDEDRVHLLGVSDGATGAWYHAFKATTPWAGFLSFIGHPAVLGNPRSTVDGEMHVVNLRGKPFFVVNGARDRLYPAAVIEPYVRLFAEAGVAIEFRPQPDAGHDLSWWDREAARVEAFIAATPRRPLPDRLTWETETAREFNRAHWLVIDELGAVRGESAPEEFDRVTVPGPRRPLGIDTVAELPDGAGLKVVEVRPGSLADEAGVAAEDVILDMGGVPARTAEAARRVLLGVRPGRSLPVTVERAGAPVRLDLRFPASQPGESRLAFPGGRTSGRVDLRREGNTVAAATRGVRRFTLLLSEDQFDLSRPVKVVVNGVVAHDAAAPPDAATLLRWAAVDQDRRLLFSAELAIEAPPAR